MPASELYSRHSGNQYRGSSPNAPTPHRNGSHISSGNVPVGQSYQPTNHDKFAVRPNPPWAGERAQNIQDDAVGPRPYWFVTRGNGIRSPLIPADELPYGLHLQGVPRQISHVESRNMKDVGYMPYGGLVYVHARLSSLISSSQSPQGRSASPSAKSIASLSQCQSVQDAGDLEEHSRKERARNSRSRAQAEQSYVPQRVDGINRVQELAEANGEARANISIIKPSALTTGDTQVAQTSTTQIPNYQNLSEGPLPPSGIIPNPAKKVYCTHWLSRGHCDFAASGCRYKHTFPNSQAEWVTHGFTNPQTQVARCHKKAVRSMWTYTMHRHWQSRELFPSVHTELNTAAAISTEDPPLAETSNEDLIDLFDYDNDAQDTPATLLMPSDSVNGHNGDSSQLSLDDHEISITDTHNTSPSSDHTLRYSLSGSDSTSQSQSFYSTGGSARSPASCSLFDRTSRHSSGQQQKTRPSQRCSQVPLEQRIGPKLSRMGERTGVVDQRDRSVRKTRAWRKKNRKGRKANMETESWH